MKEVKNGRNIYLALQAMRENSLGDELQYDYGVKDLPWRKQGRDPNKFLRPVSAKIIVFSRVSDEVHLNRSVLYFLMVDLT